MSSRHSLCLYSCPEWCGCVPTPTKQRGRFAEHRIASVVSYLYSFCSIHFVVKGASLCLLTLWYVLQGNQRGFYPFLLPLRPTTSLILVVLQRLHLVRSSPARATHPHLNNLSVITLGDQLIQRLMDQTLLHWVHHLKLVVARVYSYQYLLRWATFTCNTLRTSSVIPMKN